MAFMLSRDLESTTTTTKTNLMRAGLAFIPDQFAPGVTDMESEAYAQYDQPATTHPFHYLGLQEEEINDSDEDFTADDEINCGTFNSLDYKDPLPIVLIIAFIIMMVEAIVVISMFIKRHVALKEAVKSTVTGFEVDSDNTFQSNLQKDQERINSQIQKEAEEKRNATFNKLAMEWLNEPKHIFAKTVFEAPQKLQSLREQARRYKDGYENAKGSLDEAKKNDNRTLPRRAWQYGKSGFNVTGNWDMNLQQFKYGAHVVQTDLSALGKEVDITGQLRNITGQLTDNLPKFLGGFDQDRQNDLFRLNMEDFLDRNNIEVKRQDGQDIFYQNGHRRMDQPFQDTLYQTFAAYKSHFRAEI